MTESSDKLLKAKVVHKHKTENEWLDSNYIPKNGELVLYDPDENTKITRMKRGDGERLVKDLPFITDNQIVCRGQAEGSILNMIKDQQLANRAFSKYSTSFGEINISGSRAYLIKSYSTVEKYYELYSEIDSALQLELKYNNYETSDYDIILPSVNRIKHGKITKIEGTKVYVTKIETGDVGDPEISDWDSTNDEARFFKFINYPACGDVEFGEAAFTSGYRNKALATAAGAIGIDNIAAGKYSFVAGRGNFAGYAGFADGCFNEVTGINGKASGYMNKVTAHSAYAQNMYNTAAGQASDVGGFSNIANQAGQTIRGYFNKPNTEAIYIVGNGTHNNAKQVIPRDQEGVIYNYSNAFEVLKDGRAVIGAEPKNNMDIANKGYVDGIITKMHTTTVTGTSVEIKDIVANTPIEFSAEEIEVAIHSSNLLPCTFPGYIINGIEVSRLEDDMISASGTPTKSLDITIGRIINPPRRGVYVWSVNNNCPEDAVSLFTGRLRIYEGDTDKTTLLSRIDGWHTLVIDLDENQFFKYDKDGKEIEKSDKDVFDAQAIIDRAGSWYFKVAPSGKKFLGTGQTFRPQINMGDKVLPYEKGIYEFKSGSNIKYTPTFDNIYINSLNNKEFTCSYLQKPATGEMRLPAVTEEDNGKILCVVNGKWKAVDLPLTT